VRALVTAAAILAALGSGGVPAFSLEIAVMPVNYYERREGGYALTEAAWDITGDITERLEKYYDVRLDKTGVNDRLAGATDSDARRAAGVYEVKYVLYGSVKADGSSLTAEFRIYNARLEEYANIYAGDSIDRYDRLIKAICDHVFDWFHTERDKADALRAEIDDLKKTIEAMEARGQGKDAGREAEAPDSGLAETEKEFGLKLLVKAGYWSYVEREWVKKVQGIAEGLAGIEMYPKLQFPNIGGMRNELSLGLQVGYRYGKDPEGNERRAQGIIVNPFTGYHLNFYTDNWITFGLGAFFEYGMWHLEPSGYGRTVDSGQVLVGLAASVDYVYQFNRTIGFNLGTGAYIYFAGGTSAILRPHVGVRITLAGGWYEE
jgi:TolB-like protein